MSYQFSPAVKKLVAEARNIAIDMGYDYISTIHFFLADCYNNSDQSIKDFAFKNQDELQVFYTNQKIGEGSIFVNSLPLTLEAEKALKKAGRLITMYNDKQLHPHHLFLAASQQKKSLFYAVLEPKEELFERLERYYLKKGLIKKNAERKPLWKKILGR
jgi:ATP-dependent Clp protease ATP-binding subunit ClpA